MNFTTLSTAAHRILAVAVLTAGATGASYAQSARPSSFSVLPYTQQGYVGINVGVADFTNSCGSTPLSCDNPEVAFHVYTGGMFNPWLGLELGYLNTGNGDRAGGKTKAEGGNISLMGRLPLGAFNLFAKAGGTYARTIVTADPASGVVAGRVKAWAPSASVGAGYDFSTNATVVLELNQSNYRFAGIGREVVRTLSAGYVYRF
jgi:OmpA-OmpF porin, OOP family